MTPSLIFFSHLPFRAVRGGWMRAPAAYAWRSDVLEIRSAGVPGENFTSIQRRSSRRDVSPKWENRREDSNHKEVTCGLRRYGCTSSASLKKIKNLKRGKKNASYCEGCLSNGRLTSCCRLMTDIWGKLLPVCCFTTLENGLWTV